MIQMRWKIIAAALVMAALLSGCGGGDAQDSGANAGPAHTETVPVVTAPAETKGTEETDGGTELTALPSETPEPEEPERLSGRMPLGEPVEESWFADAVFLGDSRTDGLQLYSGIKGTTFFSYQGLSVFTIDDKECIELEDGETVTVVEALSRGTYAKVYVMLGINELGYRDTNAFKQAYLDLVDAIRESQPDADIYLQTQPPVNETVAAQKGMSEYINNERIQLFNDLIAQVAEEKETALVDVWEAYDKEDGGMPADLTSDGVHMKRAGYVIWYDYLKTHTGTTPPVAEVQQTPAAQESAAPAVSESGAPGAAAGDAAPAGESAQP